jgi:hypothetical protein
MPVVPESWWHMLVYANEGQWHTPGGMVKHSGACLVARFQRSRPNTRVQPTPLCGRKIGQF